MKKIPFIILRILPVAIISLLILLHFIFIKTHQFQLPKTLIQKKVHIEGVIDSIPQHKFHGLRFQFHERSIQHQKISTHFLISWYAYTPKLQIGQRWELTVTLKPPIGTHNPGGFDYEEYLLSHGITATGYVVTRKAHNKLLGDDHSYFLAVFRQKVEKQIDDSIHDPTRAAFISALCVGLRDGLSQSDWQVFQKTGTNHLVAIAGLHIGFVFACIYFLTKHAWRLSSRLLLIIPASRAAEIISLIGAVSYAALSGFAIPAQRASIMLCCFMIAQLFYRKISIGRRLFFSAGVILILNPFDLVDASFWLSFTSIAILAWATRSRLRSPSHLKSWGKMQLAIVVGLLPLMLFYFQQMSLIAFFANAIAIPWVGFLILPLGLMATFLFLCHAHLWSHDLFWLSGKLLLPLWEFLKYISHYSFASWQHAISNKWILIAGMIGSIFLLAPRGLSARFMGCFGLLPLFFYHPAHPAKGDYRVTVIDVGQGLAVLVQTAHHTLLYKSIDKNRGERKFHQSIVSSYLHTLDISAVNLVIQNFKVNQPSWNWDGVHFKVFDHTSIIRISNAAGSLLLTSSIQKSTESSLVKKYGDQLQSTVLLVPNEGSVKAYEKSFIDAVSPMTAIISAGEYNRYHWPAKSVLSRYLQRGIKVYNTACNGAITIRFQRKGDVRLSSVLPLKNPHPAPLPKRERGRTN